MKPQLRSCIVLCLAMAGLMQAAMCAPKASAGRQDLAADAGWKFLLGDANGAEGVSFADAAWRTVDLPHDWSIEGKPEKDNASGSGEGFFPGGGGGGSARPGERVCACEGATGLFHV